MRSPNRYTQIIEHIFKRRYKHKSERVEFSRDDIASAAKVLGIELPKNLGDVIYTFRYRGNLPENIVGRCPVGKRWVIQPIGRAKYAFVATTFSTISPNKNLSVTKIPDSTPGIISVYALSDEQALLAKLRYNRLIDIFTGVTCYSLQSHLRTTVPGMGQVETDELYIGVDRRGAHYVFPIQAKGGRDKLNIIQINQDFGLCESKFKNLICYAIGAQFMEHDLIALFAFERDLAEVTILREKHYQLVSAEQVTVADLRQYQEHPLDES